jgi:hypothetical protein
MRVDKEGGWTAYESRGGGLRMRAGICGRKAPIKQIDLLAQMMTLSTIQRVSSLVSTMKIGGTCAEDGRWEYNEDS